MSDARLRELERRWRETEDVGDEAAYLRERVRVGDLAQERLVLAARLGHTAAAHATDTSEIATSLGIFLSSIPTSCRDAGLRAGIASARVLVGSDCWGEADEVFEEELSAVEAWVLCPCDQHRREVFELFDPGGTEDPNEGAFSAPEEPLRHWHGVTWLTTAALRTGDAAAVHDLIIAGRAMDAHAGSNKLLEAARHELTPWLLGQRDPLRERVRVLDTRSR